METTENEKEGKNGNNDDHVQLETTFTKSALEPTKTIMTLVRKKDWARVARLCLSSNPHTAATARADAQYRDHAEHDNLPLYEACALSPPVRVIRALWRAYPQAASIAGATTGEYPLHVALRHNASLGVIRALVSIAPHTTYHCPSVSTPTAVQTLWNTRTIMTEQENYNAVFWQKIQALLEGVALHCHSCCKVEEEKHPTLESMKDPKNMNNSPSPGPNFYYGLHAAVTISHLDCRAQDLIPFALFQYPEQVAMRDERGRLPLHLAVGPAQWIQQTAAMGVTSHRHKVWQERQSITPLLDVYPAAALCRDPTQGQRYPLHTALAHGHAWHGGVRELCEHGPPILLVRDEETGFLPYQMAALRTDLDTIFCLLRAQPGVLQDSGKCQNQYVSSEHDKSAKTEDVGVEKAIESSHCKNQDQTTVSTTTPLTPQSSVEPHLKTPCPTICALDVMRKRQVLEMREQGTLARKRYSNFCRLGVHRRAQQVAMHSRMLEHITAVEESLRLAQAEFLLRCPLDLAAYRNILSDVSREVSSMNAEEEDEPIVHLKVHLLQHMHHVISLDKQEAMLRKDQGEIRKYLLRCQAWLKDQDTFSKQWQTLQEQQMVMQTLYESLVAQQMAVIDKHLK